MSNITPNIIDPAGPKGPANPVPPEIDPDTDGLVEPDDIREPDGERPAIEPDPEEGGGAIPTIRS
jgi:hypothetical protein